MKQTSCTVFNIERFATEDGHGIRTVVFMKGCGLACKWCGNPESQHPEAEVLVKNRICIRCGRCQAICPVSAIVFSEAYGYITDPERCTRCGRCVVECYAGARELLGIQYDTGALLHEILRDESYYRMSGGGVTFSGGEPLLYAPAISRIAKAMRERGYNTLVETCGYVSRQALAAAAQSVEYIYYDFKHIDSRQHRRLTGVGNERILENLHWLCEHYTGHLAVRYPFIPGCNTDEAALNGFFSHVKNMKNIREIVFLPYHRLGMPKYQGLGRPYEMGDLPSMKKSELDFLHEVAAQYGLNISIQ